METFSASDADAYRALARSWAASVTVVTIRRRADTVSAERPLQDGFTATAFLTVSIDPPIVLVAASNTTSARTIMQDAEAFAVNLVAHDQHDLATAFAQPHELRRDLWSHIAWTDDAAGAPLLTGALGAFSARTRQIIDAGDHVLVLGDVTALHRGSSTEPLVYHNRAYRRLHAHEESTR